MERIKFETMSSGVILSFEIEYGEGFISKLEINGKNMDPDDIRDAANGNYSSEFVRKYNLSEELFHLLYKVIKEWITGVRKLNK